MAYNEQHTIRRVLQGDTSAFGELFDRYGQRVYGLVARLTGDRVEAEDIVQDVFLKAYTGLASFKAKSSFSTWLFRIAYNSALMRVRQRRLPTLSIDDTQIDAVTDAMATAALADMSEHRIATLQKAISLLTAEEQALVTLYYYDNQPVRNIAFILSLSETAVTTRLHRIRKRLYVMIQNLEHGTE